MPLRSLVLDFRFPLFIAPQLPKRLACYSGKCEELPYNRKCEKDNGSICNNFDIDFAICDFYA